MSGSETFLQQFANFFGDSAVATFELTAEERAERDRGAEFYIGRMEFLYWGDIDTEACADATDGQLHLNASVVQELIKDIKRFMQLPETAEYFPDNVPEQSQSNSYIYRSDGSMHKDLEEYKYAVIFMIFWIQCQKGELDFIYEALMTDDIRDAYIRAWASKHGAEFLGLSCNVDAELAKTQAIISFQQAASIIMYTVHFILDFQSSSTEQTGSAVDQQSEYAEGDQQSEYSGSSVGIDDMNDEIFKVISSLRSSERLGACELAKKLRNLVIKFPNVIEPRQCKPARFLA